MPQLSFTGIPVTTIALLMFAVSIVIESVRAIAILLLLFELFRQS